LWIGKSSQSLFSPRDAVLSLYDGFLVTPAHGIVIMRWSGEIFVTCADAVSTTYAQLDYGGCLDG
jgi:hypothetical protein